MKKVVSVVLFFLLLAVSSVFAEIPVASDHASSGGGEYSFSPVTEQGFNMNIPRIKAVFDYDPGLAGVKKEGKDWTLAYVDNPKAFEGATLYVAGTQSKWPGGDNLQTFNYRSEKMLAVAPITGNSVTVHINIDPKFAKHDAYFEPIASFFILFRDGRRAWQIHLMNSRYFMKNQNGQFQTGLVINMKAGRIDPPGEEGRQKASERN